LAGPAEYLAAVRRLTNRTKPGQERRMWKFGSLLVLLAVPLVPPGAAMAQTPTPISGAMTSYAFDASALTLASGVTCRIHFINGGSKDHNFSAPQFFAASQIAAEDQVKIEKGLVALAGGQSVDILLTPGAPGTFAVECTHFIHKMMGMHGSILVQ
jgi:plastocyanin